MYVIVNRSNLSSKSTAADPLKRRSMPPPTKSASGDGGGEQEKTIKVRRKARKEGRREGKRRLADFRRIFGFAHCIWYHMEHPAPRATVLRYTTGRAARLQTILCLL